MNTIDSTYFNLIYYNNLNKYLIKNNIDNQYVVDHIIKLTDKETKTDLLHKNKVTTCTETDTATNIVSINSDVNLYKKPWSKLNIIHKTIKIKEFVNNLQINSEKNRDKIKNELINLLKKKILTKKEKVNYDEDRGIIVSLTELEYNNGMYNYKNVE
jgi:hypothetical protein